MNEKMGATIVNIFGGPGIGKSGTASGVYTLLKLNGVECELITEYAKDLVWEERHKTFKDQQYIFAKQHHRIWRAYDKVDVIITDCPLMLSPVYGRVYHLTDKAFDINVVSVTNKYDNLNIMLERNTRYKNNGRNENEKEAKAIDKATKAVLDEYNMSYTKMKTSFDCINKIASMVVGGKNLRFKIHEEK